MDVHNRAGVCFWFYHLSNRLELYSKKIQFVVGHIYIYTSLPLFCGVYFQQLFLFHPSRLFSVLATIGVLRCGAKIQDRTAGIPHRQNRTGGYFGPIPVDKIASRVILRFRTRPRAAKSRPRTAQEPPRAARMVPRWPKTVPR